MKIKTLFKKVVSSVLSFSVMLSAVSALPVAAAEYNENKYEYTLFAEGDSSSIQLNASNFTINGSIGTNGVFSTTAMYPNVNGKIVEAADTAMIYMNDKIISTYFSSGNVEEHNSNYAIKDTNININNPTKISGKLGLYGNVALNSGLMAAGDIKINGDVKNTNNAVLYSRYGDIDISCNNVNLNGLIYAPFGTIYISAQNVNINGIVIASNIIIDCPNINMNYNDNMARFIGVDSENMNIPYEDWNLLDDLDHDTIPDIVEKQILESPESVDEQWFSEKFGVNYSELSEKNKKGLAETLYYLYNHYEPKVADYLSQKLGATWGPLLMGNYYTGDDISLTCVGGQIILSIFDLDLICDIRDIAYDVTELGNIAVTDKEMSWQFAGQCVLDVIGLLPVIGVLKNTDEAALLAKKSPDIYENFVKKSMKECVVDGEIVSDAENIIHDNLKITLKKATELLNTEGKFIDEDIEEAYQRYIIRKGREGKVPRDRLEWKEVSDYMKYDSPTARGNMFNNIAQNIYDYNELNLISNTDPSKFTRLDSYVPGKMIVSRKAITLDDVVDEDVLKPYLEEMKIKYCPGTQIHSLKYSTEQVGTVLEGEMYLEIPKCNENLSNIQKYIDYAENNYGIHIIFLEEDRVW